MVHIKKIFLKKKKKERYEDTVEKDTLKLQKYIIPTKKHFYVKMKNRIKYRKVSIYMLTW